MRCSRVAYDLHDCAPKIAFEIIYKEKTRKMKNKTKIKRRKMSVVLFVLMVVVLIFGWFCKNRKSLWNGKDDFRFTVLSDERIALVSVSVERRMLNVLELDGEVSLWIPGGYGWDKSDKVK